MNTIYISLFYTYAAERICRKRGAPAWETPLFSFLYSFDSGKHLRALIYRRKLTRPMRLTR